MKNYHKTIASLSAVIAATLLPGISHAVLEEVIVTAQKREENVQTVPVAVTALSEETIRNATMIDINDVARHASCWGRFSREI